MFFLVVLYSRIYTKLKLILCVYLIPLLYYLLLYFYSHIAAKTLLNFGETCSMSTGAKFIVSATAFWVAAGVVSCYVFSYAIVKTMFYLFC